MVVLRCLQAGYYCEEDDFCKIVSAMVTNRISETMLQNLKAMHIIRFEGEIWCY